MASAWKDGKRTTLERVAGKEYCQRIDEEHEAERCAAEVETARRAVEDALARAMMTIERTEVAFRSDKLRFTDSMYDAISDGRVDDAERVCAQRIALGLERIKFITDTFEEHGVLMLEPVQLLIENMTFVELEWRRVYVNKNETKIECFFTKLF